MSYTPKEQSKESENNNSTEIDKHHLVKVMKFNIISDALWISCSPWFDATKSYFPPKLITWI